MTEWIISCEPKYYDVDRAFQFLDKIDWGQSSNICSGDLVYIYVNTPISAIKYMCIVNKVDLPVAEIDDREFFLDEADYHNYGRYMELGLIKRCNTNLLSLEQLQAHGMQGYIRGPRKAVGELWIGNTFLDNFSEEQLSDRERLSQILSPGVQWFSLRTHKFLGAAA